jgi:hypothetical protein
MTICPNANARRVLIHLPHGYVLYMPHDQSFGNFYPIRTNLLVGETLRSRLLGCKLPCSTCHNAETEQFVNRGQRGWVAEMHGRGAGCAHPLEKSAPDSEAQAYIAYLGEVNFEGTPPEMAT